MKTALSWQQTTTVEVELDVDDVALCDWAIATLDLRTLGGEISTVGSAAMTRSAGALATTVKVMPPSRLTIRPSGVVTVTTSAFIVSMLMSRAVSRPTSTQVYPASLLAVRTARSDGSPRRKSGVAGVAGVAASRWKSVTPASDTCSQPASL